MKQKILPFLKIVVCCALTFNLSSCLIIQETLFPSHYCKDPYCDKEAEICGYCAYHYAKKTDESVKKAGKLKFDTPKPTEISDNKDESIQNRINNHH